MALSRTDAFKMLCALDREAVRRGGFAEFIRLAWHIVEPTVELQWNWHLDEFAVHCEAMCPPWREGYGPLDPPAPAWDPAEPPPWALPLIYNLVVNVPPGTTKSRIFAVLWNAYVWTYRPEYRMIWASYHPNVSHDSAERCFKLVTSQWYRDRWGTVIRPGGNHAMGDYETIAGGFRFSTSVGGPLTGKHAHFLGADDPVKPAGVDSAASEVGADVQFACNWWQNTAGSRAIDKASFVRAIVMQRIHESDPSQPMIDEGAIHLMFPAKFEVERRCVTPFGGDRRELEGEPIMKEGRLSLAAFDAEAKRLGGWDGPVASAQLQQRPAPKGGLMFKDETFHKFDPLAHPLARSFSLISVDANFKKAEEASDIGIVRLGANLPKIRVHAAYSDRGGLWRCIQMIKDEIKEGGRPAAILIEDKANGSAIIETLRDKERLPNVIGLLPKESKEARAHAANMIYMAHNVEHSRAMRGTMSLEAFENSLATFPRGKKKDVVDALTQGLLFAAARDSFAWRAAVDSYSAQDRAILGRLGGDDEDGGIDFGALFSVSRQ